MTDPVIIYIPGEGVPFARAGGNGKIRFTRPKQRSYMDQVATIASVAMQGRKPLVGPLRMDARFTYLRPKSHTKAQAACLWKDTRPDASNLLKIVEDAMNTIVWHDDAQVADLTVQKKFGPVASVVITVSEIEVPA